MFNYSIIIPHYNIPDLLGRCLRSIPQRDDVQVIVVDDNSPGNEKFLETVPELSRKNVEFYVTDAGKGAGHVRNVGLSHAKGKWLIFSDSDDFFVDDFNEILDEYVDNPNDVIFFNIISCDCYNKEKRYASKKDRLFEQFNITGNEMLFRAGYTDPWGKIIRRSLVVDNNIAFQETKGHNDLLFSVITGVKAKTIEVVNKPIYWYVIREGSLGHQKGVEPLDKIKDRMLAWKSTQDFLKGNGVRLKMYLPAIPCIKTLVKSKSMLFKLLKGAYEVGCNGALIAFEIFRYVVYRKHIPNQGLTLDQQIKS